jgi:heparin/heparan-sulfate lyase
MKVNTHPRLYFTAEDIPEMREKLMAEENINAYLSHKRNVEEGMKSSFTGQLAQPAYGKSNFNDRVLGIIESLAFEYAMTNNIIYGNKAVSAMMNYLDTIVYVGNYSSTYNRPAGHMVFTASQVYDWCYNLIDGNTRNDIKTE